MYRISRCLLAVELASVCTLAASAVLYAFWAAHAPRGVSYRSSPALILHIIIIALVVVLACVCLLREARHGTDRNLDRPSSAPARVWWLAGPPFTALIIRSVCILWIVRGAEPPSVVVDTFKPHPILEGLVPVLLACFCYIHAVR